MAQGWWFDNWWVDSWWLDGWWPDHGTAVLANGIVSFAPEGNSPGISFSSKKPGISFTGKGNI